MTELVDPLDKWVEFEEPVSASWILQAAQRAALDMGEHPLDYNKHERIRWFAMVPGGNEAPYFSIELSAPWYATPVGLDQGAYYKRILLHANPCRSGIGADQETVSALMDELAQRICDQVNPVKSWWQKFSG